MIDPHQIPGGILVLDEAGSIRFANQPLLRLLHVEEGDLIGHLIEEILTIPSQILWQSQLLPALQIREQVDEVLLQLRWKAQGEVSVLLSGRKRPTPNGPEIILCLLPATERNEWQKLVLQAKAEAERERQALEKRTQELEQTRIELLELNEEKNRILGIAAHDVRNPIANVVSLCSLLQEEIPTAGNGELISMIRTMEEGANYVLELLKNLLDFSKIEAGKRELIRHKVDLLQLIKQSLSLQSPHAALKQIHLDLQAEEGPCEAFLSATSILQVLQNLISNAIKFSPDHTTVTVQLERTSEDLILRVMDEGPGISAADQENIFQAFTKGSNSPTRGESSSGLGLWITQRLVKSHGGEIRVENRDPQGAAFVVTLPLIPDS